MNPRRLAQAILGTPVSLAGARVRVPGPLPIRLSVVAGNERVHRLMSRALAAGATAIDVGAHTGYNTVFAARLVGPTGRVVAVEPTPDNGRILQENVRANHLANVEIHIAAAGRTRGSRTLFLRGDHSAVNSLYPTSQYGIVTSSETVDVVPVDELAPHADLVKIDVEGSELDVLGGMTRLLQSKAIRLIVEWHPRLQIHAGYDVDALPRFLLDGGFSLQMASHLSTRPLARDGIAPAADRLLEAGRPVELFARRPG